MTFNQGHALLIGVSKINKYPKSNTSSLVNDVQELQKTLISPLFCAYPSQQVHILVEEQATRAAILAALDQLASSTSADDTVLIMFSGHGVHSEKGYALTCYDSLFNEQKKLVEQTGIELAELLEKLKAIQSKRLVFINNSCFSGNVAPVLGNDFADEADISEKVPSSTNDAILATGSGRIIINACSAEQCSYIGLTEMTVFAHVLNQGLQGIPIVRKGYISIFDLYEYLYEEVSSLVKNPKYVHPDTYAKYKDQEPEISIIKASGSFAIAHYRGTQPQAPYQPSDLSLEGNVREVEQSKAEKQLAKFIGSHNTEQTITYNNSTHNGDNVGRDNITNIHGSQFNISDVKGGTIYQVGEYNVIQPEKKTRSPKQQQIEQLQDAKNELIKFRRLGTDAVKQTVTEAIGMIDDLLNGTQKSLTPDTSAYLSIADQVEGLFPELANALRQASKLIQNYH